MRHPMLRGFAALLALALVTAPTPVLALRAGLEGTDAKKKIEAALTSTPRAGLEERSGEAQMPPAVTAPLKSEEGRFALTMSVDRSVTSAVQAATARIAQIPERIRKAHQQILAAGERFMLRADVETAAAQNPFIRIGAEWQEDPAGHPGQIRVISRLGPYTMPDHLLQHPDQLQQVQTEADAFRARFTAEGTALRRVDHLGMGGSAGIGRALQQSGLLRQRPGVVVETSDRSVWRALLPDTAEMIVEYLKTTGVEPMSMGMTSEEPVILLAYYAELCRVLSVPLDPRLEMLTLKHSSVYQFAEAQQMAHRLIALQPDGRETAAGRMSGPTATKFPLRFLALNGIDLTEWVGQARLSQKEQETFLSFGTALAVLAEQGKNKVTLVLPKELAFLAPWLKQLFEESLGRAGKGPLDQFDPQVPFKVVIDEPLDPAFHRPAAESDRVFLTLQTDDARLSTAQADFLTLMQNVGHPRLNVEVQGAWEKRLAGIFQGGLVTLAAVADRWGLRFINQPSVEEYKRIAKLMVIEAMRAGGYLKTADFDANGTVIPKRYFEELPRWILRKSPTHVEFSQTAMYRDILEPNTPLPTAVDGQVRVAYAGLAPEMVQAQVSAMGGSMTNAADVVRAILALKQATATTGPVMGGTFHPTPSIVHVGDLTVTVDGRRMAASLDGIATTLFRRPWQRDVEVWECPDANHKWLEMNENDPEGLTIILLPETTDDSPVVSMSDDYRVIQGLATYRASKRTVILVTYPKNDAAGRAALETFIRQVAAPAGLEEDELPTTGDRPYDLGTPVTLENVRAITRGAFLGLRQADGSVGYFRVAQVPGQRDNFGLTRVDAAGQLLDREGPSTWLYPRQLLEPARAARLVTLTTGLEEAKVFAMDSSEAKELAKQLGSAPAGVAVSGIGWVPAEMVDAQYRTWGAADPRGRLEVYMAEALRSLPVMPPALNRSWHINWHPLPSENLPAPGQSVVVALQDQVLPVTEAHAPILRIAGRGDVAWLTDDLLVAIGTSELFWNREIYAPAAKLPVPQRVQFQSQWGFAFYLYA